jgi:hypothetical protein
VGDRASLVLLVLVHAILANIRIFLRILPEANALAYLVNQLIEAKVL